MSLITHDDLQRSLDERFVAMGPPDEWSGSVAASVSAEERAVLRRAWEKMPEGRRDAIMRRWMAKFNEATKAEQLNLFSGADHGGRLHVEVRFDRTGRSEHRHLRAESLHGRLGGVGDGAKAMPLDPPPEQRRPREHHHHGSVKIEGLPRIDVESPQDTVRRGVSADGTPWATLMPAHYGEFRGTLGVDGDAVDVFVGDYPEAPRAYVIRALDPRTGRYDEDKVMVGFRSREEAERTFRQAYDCKGVLGEVLTVRVSQLAAALADARNRGKALRLRGHEGAKGIDVEDDFAENEPSPPGPGASREDVLRRLAFVKGRIALLARHHEGLKAVDRRDTATLSLFPVLDRTHGGHLHPEQRTDRIGRTESRWVETPEPGGGGGSAGPRARGEALPVLQADARPGPRAGRMLEGLGAAPTPAPIGHVPNLRDYDTILVNSSAGKDSQATLDYMVEQAREQGVLDRVVVVHADLGRVEWEGTRELAEEQARHYGLRFEVVKRGEDLLDQIGRRDDALKQRRRDVEALEKAGIATWEDLVRARHELIAAAIEQDHSSAARAAKLQEKAKEKLAKGVEAKKQAENLAAAHPSPDAKTRQKLASLRATAEKLAPRALVDFGKEIAWPSSDSRYCTSDQKRGPIRTLMTRLADEHRATRVPEYQTRILNCLGLRGEEGDNRAKMEPFTRSEHKNSRRDVDEWLPIHHWKEGDVWRRIRDAGTRYHWAYDLGMGRLSCVFCIFASPEDLAIAARHNPALFAEYVALERRIGHKFKANLALAEVADAIAAEPAPEAGKAEQLGLSLDLSHGGTRHAEERTDKTGRTERRWVATPATASGQGQLALFDEAQRYRIDLGGYFASGSNHAGEIYGFADIGVNPGGTASEMNREAEWAATELAGRQAPDGRLVRFFLDSGAFGEIAFTPDGPVDKDPITHAEWEKRLDLYERLAEKLGPQLYAVAPDKVADQEETLRRLTRYAERVNLIRGHGATILVPIQKGDMSMAAFAGKVDAILGGTWTPAIPMKKDATSDEDLHAFLAARQPPAVHLLGVGPKSRRFPDIERIVGEASPRTKVTLDSVAITAAVGRPEGGEPRKLTAALDKIREEVAEETFMGDGEDLPDYTDHIASPSSWTTPGERRRIAQDMGLDATSTRAFVADPEAWLHRAFRPEEEGDDDAVLNIEMPQIEIALDEAWHRFFNGSGSTIARKRRSIRLAFGEGGKAEPFDLDGFSIAAGGD